MGRDRSLDEFLNQGQTPPDRDADAQPASDPDDESARTSLPVDPARPTMTWSPDGAVCDACGDSVKRRWRDGEQLVCPACKKWD